MLSIARLKHFKLSVKYELFEKIKLMPSEVRLKIFRRQYLQWLFLGDRKEGAALVFPLALPGKYLTNSGCPPENQLVHGQAGKR